jgi:hypothetical protein
MNEYWVVDFGGFKAWFCDNNMEYDLVHGWIVVIWWFEVKPTTLNESGDMGIAPMSNPCLNYLFLAWNGLLDVSLGLIVWMGCDMEHLLVIETWKRMNMHRLVVIWAWCVVCTPSVWWNAQIRIVCAIVCKFLVDTCKLEKLILMMVEHHMEGV